MVDSRGAHKLNGPRKASTRIGAIELSNRGKQLGLCGNVEPLAGTVCTRKVRDCEIRTGNDGQSRAQPFLEGPYPECPGPHQARQIGGPNDGYVYAEWR